MLFLWVVRRRCSGPFTGLHDGIGRPPESRSPCSNRRPCDQRSQESLHREPLQDIVVAVPMQHGTGGDRVPGERPVVAGLKERVTEFLVCAGPSQVRPEGAEQDKVAGGERFSGQPDEPQNSISGQGHSRM